MSECRPAGRTTRPDRKLVDIDQLGEEDYAALFRRAGAATSRGDCKRARGPGGSISRPLTRCCRTNPATTMTQGQPPAYVLLPQVVGQ
jgi:hypothetical protein